MEKLAYIFEEGDKNLPCLVFLPGFRSDMTGLKAQYLAAQCKSRNQASLRLDYSGHGQSGGAFVDGGIGPWTQDVLQIIDQAVPDASSGPLLVVGSSMGGWIGLQVALQRHERVQGFIGIAAAPDFTRTIKTRLNPDQREKIETQGFFTVPSVYGEDMVITRHLLEDGEKQCLLDGAISLSIPVTLIQGKKDKEVDWQTAERIKAAITPAQAKIIYVEDGDHRLSREEDLNLIDGAVCAMNALLG